MASGPAELYRGESYPRRARGPCHCARDHGSRDPRRARGQERGERPVELVGIEGAEAEPGRAFFDGDNRWLQHYGFNALDVPTLSGGVGA